MRPIIGIDAAAIKLTDRLLGYDDRDLADILREIAANIGVKHIAYLRFSAENSVDVSLLTAVVTYSREWQTRYFLRKYSAIDPVVTHGSRAVLPFDWEDFEMPTPAVASFFADALNHGVGLRGVSIPVRNRRNACALVSLNGDHDKAKWEEFKRENMVKLQILSALIELCCWNKLEAFVCTGPVVQAGGAVPGLGREGQNLPGSCRNPEYKLRQREDALGHGAS